MATPTRSRARSAPGRSSDVIDRRLTSPMSTWPGEPMRCSGAGRRSTPWRPVASCGCCWARSSTRPSSASRPARRGSRCEGSPSGCAPASPSCPSDDFFALCWSLQRQPTHGRLTMRTLTFGMNLSLDGYISAPGDDLGWSVPSDELFQWWSDRVAATGLALYGRKLWETMSSHWPTADQQPGATPAEIEFSRRWREMPKVVFSSRTSTVGWNTRLVTGDAIAEITRLKAEDGDGPIDIGGATLAAAAMRAGLIDEYLTVTHPVLLGGGTPFFTALDQWVNLTLVETRTFPDGVVLTRYETRR